uniref:Putative secreted peptide n=1 Tax=Anopheles braziliensis TaxID=58242 RepID=A0A2M3ZWV9_9DIPT
MYILFLLVGFAYLWIPSTVSCLVVSCSFFTLAGIYSTFTPTNGSILLLRTVFFYNMNNNFVCDCVLCYV